MSKLDAETRAMVERIQSTRELTEAQRKMLQSAEKAASGFLLIEGDKVANMSQMTMPQMPPSDYGIISGDKVVGGLQEFNDAIQQTAEKLEELAPMKALAEKQAELTETTQGVSDAQKTLSEALSKFPADYLKNLADGAKAVSDTQSFLIKSTLDLVDAQSKLRDALNNLPDIKLPENVKPTQEKLPPEGFVSLSTSTQELNKVQDLVRTAF